MVYTSTSSLDSNKKLIFLQRTMKMLKTTNDKVFEETNGKRNGDSYTDGDEENGYDGRID